jgi:hypothetical protein
VDADVQQRHPVLQVFPGASRSQHAWKEEHRHEQ